MNVAPTPIRPDNHDFDVAGESTMEENAEEIDVQIEKGNGGPKVEELDGDEPCHPVESGEVADHDAVDDEAEEEHVAPGALRDPGQPSPAERAEHDLTHIPYRPWCKHCVRGRAKGRQSRKLRSGDS